MSTDLIQTLTMFGTVVAAFAAAAAAFYAARQVKALGVQLEQTQAQLELTEAQVKQSRASNHTQLANQHNWNQFDRHEHLPPLLPSWAGLTDRGWAWRVLLFNHLNMVLLAYEDHKRGILDDDELKDWILKARYWFRSLWAESPDPEIREGYEIFRQILRPEEGYSEEFRNWLVRSKIVSPAIVSDLD
jgi:hypothetical protein